MHVIFAKIEAGHEGSVSIRPNLDLDYLRDIESRLLFLKFLWSRFIFFLSHMSSTSINLLGNNLFSDSG